jgi:hypothetical protein
MGQSLKPIPIFSDQIELDVHTASYRSHLGHTAICHFADGQPVNVWQIEETGEYYVKRKDGAFMQGQEI